MSIIQEFKTFAMRGNVVDLAVGVVIGGAFGKIVSSLVNDLIMPPIGLLMGGMDFSKLALTMKDAAGTAPAVTLNYGMFINAIIDFLIIAFSIFLLVKTMNSMKIPVAPPPAKKACPECKMEIPIDAKRCGFCTSVVA